MELEEYEIEDIRLNETMGLKSISQLCLQCTHRVLIEIIESLRRKYLQQSFSKVFYSIN